MKIKLAESLGYCLGVRRAMNMAFRHLSRRGEKVFSHGELIHNNPALELLTEKGLKIWNGETSGAIIVRAHGLPPEQLQALKRTDLTISDATCPRVLKVQNLVAREAGSGRDVIIWGGANHPEVIGLVGHSLGRGYVVKDAAEVAKLPQFERVLLVSQTTQDLEQWPEIEAAVLARWPEAMIRNTICEATVARQGDVRQLVEEVDALLIIGGKTSGNTARLAGIGRRKGLKTLLAETVDDLEPDWFQGVKTLGIAAGASTSNWQIGQILEAVRTMTRPKGSFLPRLMRALVLSNIYAALGMAGLSQCAALLMGLPLEPFIFSFFFFQVISIHLLRDFTKGQTVKFNDPDRQYFMTKYRRPLIVFGALSFVMAALGAATGGTGLTFLMGIMWLTTLIYQFAPRPRGYEDWNIARLLVKPAVLAAGWGAALVGAAGLFNMSPDMKISALTALSALVAISGHIFSLVIMGDVLGAQGDQIFGRPSLPIILGEKRTKNALKLIFIIWTAWLAVSGFSGALPPLAFLMIISGPLYCLALLKPLFRSPYGYLFEAAMYGQLILTLAWVLVWAA
ncbi:4-hydroxy-3-methylbut-2-enyl diphosphate reductase [Deltaproteobacteria bacterium Smac51]|nr:4-hydroxy-3-methylbut-2-enyl diphosphate reductase [Deltaproteobacteria bacterium Smac51]